MNSAAVSIHQPDATIEDFIDVVEGNRSVIDFGIAAVDADYIVQRLCPCHLRPQQDRRNQYRGARSTV